jgi:hypothetical protein
MTIPPTARHDADDDNQQRVLHRAALAAGGPVIKCQLFIRKCSITAMIACVFERARWRFVRNGRLAWLRID